MFRASQLTIILFLFITQLTSSCSKETISGALPDKTNSNLKYFGYTLVDVGWDDPTDANNKTNYIDEVHDFSNIADILVSHPEENIIERMQNFDALDVKAILHLSEIFFEQKSIGGDKSGFIYGLREDFQERWDSFVSTNELSVNYPLINCFYIGEEPAWNGITESEFEQACDYAKSTVPQVPIFTVEAYLDVDNFYAPNSVDWVAFDHYFLPEPSTNIDYLNEFKIVKSKMKSHQKMFLILDAHWIKLTHGSSGISKEDMDFVARDYYRLANSDSTIIGLIGYFWPNGFDIKNSIGTRGLPENVLIEHKKIGKMITGK